MDYGTHTCQHGVSKPEAWDLHEARAASLTRTKVEPRRHIGVRKNDIRVICKTYQQQHSTQHFHVGMGKSERLRNAFRT